MLGVGQREQPGIDAVDLDERQGYQFAFPTNEFVARVPAVYLNSGSDAMCRRPAVGRDVKQVAIRLTRIGGNH